jgi:hypothetical protein
MLRVYSRFLKALSASAFFFLPSPLEGQREGKAPTSCFTSAPPGADQGTFSFSGGLAHPLASINPCVYKQTPARDKEVWQKKSVNSLKKTGDAQRKSGNCLDKSGDKQRKSVNSSGK